MAHDGRALAREQAARAPAGVFAAVAALLPLLDDDHLLALGVVRAEEVPPAPQPAEHESIERSGYWPGEATMEALVQDSPSSAGAAHGGHEGGGLMPLTPSQRSQRARVAAHAMHAQHDARITTRKARATFLASFEDKVDPDGVLSPQERAKRAESARKAHFAALALKSSTLRTKRRQAGVA